MGRIILAAIVGGILSFVWGFVSHVMLEMGATGLKQLPAEPLASAALASLKLETGVYPFPSMDMEKSSDMESPEYKDWAERYAKGPTGMVVYNAEGIEPMGTQQMGTEFLTGVIAAGLMALVVCQSRCNFMGRWGLCLVMGVLTWVAGAVPFWNWWRFPADFMLVGTASDHILGAAIAGLAVAAIARPGKNC